MAKSDGLLLLINTRNKFMPEQLLIFIGTEETCAHKLDLWRSGLHFASFSLTSLQLELSSFAGFFVFSVRIFTAKLF